MVSRREENRLRTGSKRESKDKVVASPSTKRERRAIRALAATLSREPDGIRQVSPLTPSLLGLVALLLVTGWGDLFSGPSVDPALAAESSLALPRARLVLQGEPLCAWVTAPLHDLPFILICWSALH